MLDISHKYNTLRTAIAEATLEVSKSSIKAIKSNSVPKGDVFTVSKVAGTLAAKNVSQIIPYCHNISIDYVNLKFDIKNNNITITSEVKSINKTGVEMEALTSVCVAALTVYDMLKMIDDKVLIKEIRLVEKRGGKTDFTTDLERRLKAAVLVLSDSISQGKKGDESGRLIVERLKANGVIVKRYEIMPDNREEIKERLKSLCDKERLDLIITTGGTGFSPRDNTPEATLSIIEREIPGIPEAIRDYGQQRTPYSMLSRGIAGIRGNTIIINLPGSKKGVKESLDILFPSIFHSFKMLWMGGH
ncbi:MAG: bifunctional molybdenum cofactor biosynthesis protein MoaC/MoaB [Myxococcota bacterium]